jgi:hypothetical protein
MHRFYKSKYTADENVEAIEFAKKAILTNDSTRPALSKVFYDKDKKVLVGTDGKRFHISRFESDNMETGAYSVHFLKEDKCYLLEKTDLTYPNINYIIDNNIGDAIPENLKYSKTYGSLSISGFVFGVFKKIDNALDLTYIRDLFTLKNDKFYDSVEVYQDKIDSPVIFKFTKTEDEKNENNYKYAVISPMRCG